jgi:hypothetical protein
MQFSKFTALFRRRQLVQRVDEELQFPGFAEFPAKHALYGRSMREI